MPRSVKTEETVVLLESLKKLDKEQDMECCPLALMWVIWRWPFDL